MRAFQVLAGLLTITAAVALGVANAQGDPQFDPQAGPQVDPPSRVARLNFMQGSVSFRPGGVDDWAAATLNFPLHTGDFLWADQGAKTELHVGSTAIRMDQTTAISVVNLNDQIAQFSLTAGSLNVHIRYLGEGENFEVDTPNAAIMLLRAGDYRINADGDNNTTSLIVRGGDAEVTAGPSGAFNVPAGQMAMLMGVDNVQHEISAALPPDSFDVWTRDRDAREDRATMSARYVPRETIGYEDLDANGRWVDVPQYGMVWQPTAIPVGWAPYHNGHWAWVDPWGWTWIDDAPWGFAPFHYGRWASVGGGWYWVPGAVAVRPVYSPALVAFVGGGGIGVGVAAWFPLGPGEVYRPAYHVSEVYVRNVNIAYVRNVTVIMEPAPVVFANQRVVGAVTVVPHEVFVGARPVAVAAVAVRPEMVVSARVGFVAAYAPERVSVMAGGVAVVRTPPAVVVQRTVVVRHAAPAPPVAFAARQEALRANPGRPLDAQQVNRIRATEPPRPSYVRPVGQPAGFNRGPNTAPPPMRNDRPANARPVGQPENRPAEVRPNPPANRPPDVRPENRPNNEIRPNNQPRPNNEVRPNNEQRPNNEARPNNEQRPNERKPPEKGKKNDRTDKK
jgi:hypothetical protein